MEIKPHVKVKLENGYIWHFYKKSDCIESQKVEKVEQVNLPEAELDSEELATENGKALNDNELAAIIDACKDPIDKTMILSALCFGIRTGELDSLNLRDISGAEICLQSPSGVVKMRIPKQYEDARTELITYYVDNGNSLSGDMPVFLNRSGVRMTRQGLNNRMKSVSESANIGRDVKLADLRATFAQNIYKKTEKNIASVHKYLRLSGNTNIMGYLLETQTKDQKAMPVDLMNSLTASYQVKEPLSIAESKEQTPDIIPADTIDLFTMSELESELKQRGVELTAEVKAKINASDMPEMQEIATMIRGNAKTIAIRLSALNEISGQLKKIDANNTLKTKVERVLHYASRKTSLTKHDACELNNLGYLTRNQALKMLSPFTTQERAQQIFSKHILKAYLYGNNRYVVLWDKDVVEQFIDDEESRLSIAETFTPISDCISEKTDNAIPTLSNENKLDTILSRLNEIEHQIVHHENFGPSEDIINHFKSAIQSRSNILSALMSRAKIVIHNESCVILLDQKFAVDKVSESIGKEMINNALMDIGCKDFNIYVLFSGKCDVKNNQEK